MQIVKTFIENPLKMKIFKILLICFFTIEHICIIALYLHSIGTDQEKHKQARKEARQSLWEASKIIDCVNYEDVLNGIKRSHVLYKLENNQLHEVQKEEFYASTKKVISFKLFKESPRYFIDLFFGPDNKLYKRTWRDAQKNKYFIIEEHSHYDFAVREDMCPL